MSTLITPEILAKKEQIVAMFSARLRKESIDEATLHDAIGRGAALTNEFIASIKQSSAKPKKQQLLGLLKRISTVTLAGYDKFVSIERFKIDTSASAELPISFMSENFRNQILGLVETDVPETVAIVSRLTRNSKDGPIRQELGDEHELTIGQFHQFMKTADFYMGHVCYVPGRDGQVWAVYAYWIDDGWDFNAFSVSRPFPWQEGFHFVSRGSVAVTD